MIRLFKSAKSRVSGFLKEGPVPCWEDYLRQTRDRS